MQIGRIGIALAVHEPTIDYFVEQLTSLVRQTFGDWICVISFDSPAAPVVTHPDVAPILADPRFRVGEGPRRLGAAKNFERAIGMTAAEGVDAIACCDYDDRWHPEKLAILADALATAGPLSLVHSDLDLFDDRGPLRGTAWQVERRHPDHSAPWQLLVRNVVTGCAMMFDAELARRYGEVPPEARLHDRWFALVAACHGGVHAISRPLVSYRVHGAQDTGIARYRGLLAAPPGVRGPSAFLRECVRVWRNAHDLARAAIDRGVPFPPADRARILRDDLGLGLAVGGARRIADDPVLARAAIGAAAGKLLAVVSRGAIPPLPERTAVPPRS